MADLVCDKDEQVAEDFYWYLLHSTAANAFPEGIYYKRRYAWAETIPHVTGAATTPSSSATCWSTSKAMNSIY